MSISDCFRALPRYEPLDIIPEAFHVMNFMQIEVPAEDELPNV